MAKNKTGWDRSLGTSKAEQGIVRIPPPRLKKDCKKCWFRGKEPYRIAEWCFIHNQDNIMKKLNLNVKEGLEKTEETK